MARCGEPGIRHDRSTIRAAACALALAVCATGPVPAFGQGAPLQLIPVQPGPTAGDGTQRLGDGIEVQPLEEEGTVPSPDAPPAPTPAPTPAPGTLEPISPSPAPAIEPAPPPATGTLTPPSAPAAGSTEPAGSFTFDPDAPMPEGPIGEDRLDAARERVEERAATRVLSDADLREMPVTELLNRLGREGYVELRGISRTATGYRIDAVNRSLEAVVIEFDPVTGVATERPR